MVFQNFELFPHLIVRANLALAQQKFWVTANEAWTRCQTVITSRTGRLRRALSSKLIGWSAATCCHCQGPMHGSHLYAFRWAYLSLRPEMVQVLDVLSWISTRGRRVMCVTQDTLLLGVLSLIVCSLWTKGEWSRTALQKSSLPSQLDAQDEFVTSYHAWQQYWCDKWIWALLVQSSTSSNAMA